MALFMNNTKVKSVYWNNVKAKKVYFNNVLVLSGEFAFTYTGAYAVEGDLGGNFVIRFKTSGTLTITDAGNTTSLDVFLVGGGGGGGGGHNAAQGHAGSGGGGGYTTNRNDLGIKAGAAYLIVIGAGGDGGSTRGNGKDGGETSAFNATAAGGSHGTGTAYVNDGGAPDGGKGGSGGGGGLAKGYSGQDASGGTDGGNGKTPKAGGAGGKGQGTTTREFGQASGILYSSGGYGGRYPLQNGDANTGNGGDGGHYYNSKDRTNNGAPGGSGIVCIRNHR